MVIAIIAILAAMLLPALAAAKAKAQNIACLNNMKQWGLANSMYVDDNSEVFPWPRYQVSQTGLQDNPQWTDVVTFYDLALQGNDKAKSNGVWFNALPSYVAGKTLYIHGRTILTVFTSQKIHLHLSESSCHGHLCGGHKLKPRLYGSGVRPLFNYGMNSKSTVNETPANYPSGTSLALKSGMIVHPSAFVMFSDVRDRSDDLPFYGSAANQIDLATPHCYTTRFSARHNKGGNITFGDGHAAYFKYSYVVADGIQNPSITAGHDPGEPDINWDCSGITVP